MEDLCTKARGSSRSSSNLDNNDQFWVHSLFRGLFIPSVVKPLALCHGVPGEGGGGVVRSHLNGKKKIPFLAKKRTKNMKNEDARA